MLRVFTCTDHACHYPVGCASVVVAAGEVEARAFLRVALKERGLDPNSPFTLTPVDLDKPHAIVLHDGDY